MGSAPPNKEEKEEGELISNSSSNSLNKSAMVVSSRCHFAPRGSTPRILFYTAIYGFASAFYTSYSSSYTNTAAQPLRRYLNESYVLRGGVNDTYHHPHGGAGLSPTAESWLWSLLLNANYLGFFVGTCFVPLAADHLGRRMCLLIGTGLQLVASFLDVLAVIGFMPELFIASRVLGNGANSMMWGSLILIVIESVPTPLRGTCTFIIGTAWSAGLVVGMFFGMDIVLGEKLPFLIGVGIPPSLAAFLITWVLKETPKFLLSKHLNQLAKRRPFECAEAPREEALVSIYFYQGLAGDEAAKAVDATLNELRGEEGAGAPTTGKLSFVAKLADLYRLKHLRRAVLLGISSLLVAIGVYQITTQLLAVHFGQAQAQLFATLLMVINLVAGMVGTFIVHRMQRRMLLIGSSATNVFALLVYVVCDRLAASMQQQGPLPLTTTLSATAFFSWLCLAAMFVYQVAYGIGFGTIAFYLSSELLPQSYRSTGQSLAFFVALLFGFLFNFVTLPAYEAWNVWVFLPIFIIPQTLCVVYLWRRLPETRNREIGAIVAELMRN